MDYSATEAVLFGKRLLDAGHAAQKRNTKPGQHWHVVADHDNLKVTLNGSIQEDVTVFLEQRRAS
jgi:hypothetical protein